MQGISPKTFKHMSTTSDDCEMRDMISLESKSSADFCDLKNSKVEALDAIKSEKERKADDLRALLHALKKETEEAKRKKEAGLQTDGSISEEHHFMEEVEDYDSGLEMDMCESKKIEF